MPTSPNRPRLASSTNALPGPTRTSTGGIVSVPSAIAATAWAPPMAYTSSTPARLQAASTACDGRPSDPGAEHTAISLTPATWAGTSAITALDGYAARPPGAYTPARSTGIGRVLTICPWASTWRLGWGIVSRAVDVRYSGQALRPH